MFEIFLTIAVPFALVLATAGAMRLRGQPVAAMPLLLGFGCVLIYIAVSVGGSLIQRQLPVLADVRWNWTGKIIVIAATLAMMWLIPRMSRQEVGLTWRQRPGPVWPIVLVIAASCAIAWGNEAWQADGTSVTLDRIMFQATMPGLDEELFARGLLLALFVRAFGRGRGIAGGAFGAAGLAVTILFALGHGLRFADGWPVINVSAVLVSGSIGALLVWLRQRTGSLVLPVLTHNLVNVGSSFF